MFFTEDRSECSDFRGVDGPSASIFFLEAEVADGLGLVVDCEAREDRLGGVDNDVEEAEGADVSEALVRVEGLGGESPPLNIGLG